MLVRRHPFLEAFTPAGVTIAICVLFRFFSETRCFWVTGRLFVSPDLDQASLYGNLFV